MIAPQQVQRMRSQVRTKLGSTAVVLRQTVIETETGSRIDYLPVTGAVPAGVRDPNVGSETVLAARVQAGSVATVLLPLHDDQGREVTVQAADRLSVTTTDPVSRATTTVTMEVVGVAGRLSEWPIVQRAVCEVRT